MRILITKEDDFYIAQGLEIGIFAQAKTLGELAERFKNNFLLNQDTKMAEEAPSGVFEAWENGEVCDADLVSFDESALGKSVDVRLVAA